MTRLPIQGADDGTWGGILNDFLSVEHNSDGTLKTTGGTLSNYYIKPGTGIPATDMTAAAQASLSSATTAVQPGLATTKGDLLAATAAATISRLGVGSNGQLLTADSSQPTGLGWKTPVAAVTNVRDYGATGNGSTDDTTAIRNAITAAKASTQTIYFPPGNYIVSGMLNVGGGYPGGLHIYGCGWDSQISLANNANCYIFGFGNVYTPGAVIRDLFLSCNGANQTADSGGIDAYGAVNCLFESLQIDTPFYDGIYVHDDGTGSFAHHNTISNSLFVNGKHSAGLGQALELFEADENYIINCTFGDNGNPNNTYAFHNGAQPGGTVYQVFDSAGLQHFIGNSFVNGGAGVTQMRLNGSRNTVAQNIFDGGSHHQLHINGWANTVQGNIFSNIGSAATSGNPGAGLYLDSKSRIMVSGNVFSPVNSGQGYATAGIWTDFGADYNDIFHNEFSLDAVTGTWQYGAAIRLNNGGGHNNLGGNNGFTTLAVGSASITNVQTSVTVNHGLALTPTNIILTPQGNLSTATYWVSGISSTQFTINVSASPSSTTAFFWQAQVLAG